MSKIYYILGKSSTGKDTIYKRLLERNSSLNKICLYTTRPKRSDETDGDEYHFTDEEGYEEIRSNGLLIEERSYNTMHGLWRYFTVNDGQFDNQEKNYLIGGVLESYVSTRKYFGEDKVIPIFLDLPDEIRLHRALSREKLQEEPKYAELCRRFISDTEDFSEEKLKEAGINKRFLNIDLDECIDQIEEYIKETI